jgi:two-component system NtrC family sensor kinase
VQREASLFQALTATDRLSDLLPVLHHHAVSAVEGRSSILFQFSRAGDTLQATSAFGVDHLPADPLPAELLPDALFRDETPQFVADASRIVRGGPEYLGAQSAVLVPLAKMQEPMGVLVISCDTLPLPQQLSQAASVGHAFTLALDRARATGEAHLQVDLRELLQTFSRDVSSMTLAAGLEAICIGANRLFGATRTSVWLHDRRARMVVLSASSDVVYLAQERRIPTTDTRAPAAVALRHERADIAATGTSLGGAPTAMVTIPLKGRRRALGTLVMEEVRVEPGSQIDLLERADEMGRQLAAAVENVLLLDAVLRSRRELENTFNSLADLVAVSDQDGLLVSMNVAFVQRVGMTKQELVDRPIAEVVGPATSALIQAAAKSANEGSDHRDYRGGQTPTIVYSEVEDPKLRGTFVVTLTPLIGEEHESIGIVFVARDVTPQAELEAERAELRNRLVQSEKLAALGQFVAGIAHELNNPLQGVLGHLELMRATGAFPKGLRRDMQRIYREADRAAKIVRNLLVFAGSRRLVRRRTSLNATLSRVLSLRAPAFRAANIEVVRQHSESLPRVKGDPLLLQQALLNIVLNAEQALGENGGRIETSTSVRQDGDGEHVVVQIRDTGPGIEPAALPRVFEPFYTTKEVGKGTGLGLAITYGIIQEHGGQIVASNHPEGGAVFTVQLPVENG